MIQRDWNNRILSEPSVRGESHKPPNSTHGVLEEGNKKALVHSQIGL